MANELFIEVIRSLGPNALLNQPKDCTNPNHIACRLCEPELFEDEGEGA